MSDRADHAELARKARLQQERLEAYAAAVERGEIQDLTAEDLPPLDEAEELARWERVGRILRAADPTSYRMIAAVAVAFAALADATPEN